MSQTFQAVLWMTGAVVSFTSMAVAGRAVSLDLDTFEIMLYRSIIGAIIVTSVLMATGKLSQINRDRFGLHVARNISHFAGQNCWFFAVATIPLAQVFALEFTSPLYASRCCSSSSTSGPRKTGPGSSSTKCAGRFEEPYATL